MAIRVALLAVLLLASSASAVIEVRCPDGMTWYGTAWEKCPCCERCGDGWIVEGEECDPAAVLPASVEVEGEGEFGLGLVDTIFLVPYIVPSLVAYRRRHPNKTAIFAFNLLLGWTVLGWVVALVWALTNPRPTGAR